MNLAGIGIRAVAHEAGHRGGDGSSLEWGHYAIRGYVLDKERLKNGSFFNKAYFEKDWAAKLNAFLQFNERDILDNPGKVSQEVAQAFAESEFEKYRIVQDRLFESDFDRHIKKALEGGEKQP